MIHEILFFTLFNFAASSEITVLLSIYVELNFWLFNENPMRNLEVKETKKLCTSINHKARKKKSPPYNPKGSDFYEEINGAQSNA